MELLKTMLTTSALGISTVFVGLICIIILVELMHKILSVFSSDSAAATKSAPASAPSAVPSQAVYTAPIVNRGELVAAVSAAIAEELGTDVSAIRITSLRQVGAPTAQSARSTDRGELVAAISAAIAEDIGTEANAIRITSLRKI